MQMRPKTYLHFMSLWRSLRGAMPPHHDDAPREASPVLIYAAVVLAFLLAIQVVNVHRSELERLGLLPSDYPIQDVALGP
jgi:hypothetical protein